MGWSREPARDAEAGLEPAPSRFTVSRRALAVACRRGRMIRVRGLSKVYPDGKQALTGVDLDLGEGMLGLLGPNGAGKTTLISMLVLAVEPTKGERIYGELSAARGSNRAAIRATIGYLPQEFQPIQRLTGLEYLGYCARLRSVRLSRRRLLDRCRALLDIVGLADASDRYTREYSGGMKRRLGIAQALIHAPRFLVVDEPTAGLDPEERIRFRNMIAEAAEEATVLLSTHIVEDIEATCPRIAVIASGRLVFEGSPSDLLQRFDGSLWEIGGEETPPRCLRVARRTAVGSAPRWLVHAEAPVSDGSPARPTLEEAYAALLALHGESPGDAEEPK